MISLCPLCPLCPLWLFINVMFLRVALVISNGLLSPRWQLALGFFGSNVMEVQKRLYSIFGFNF